MSSIPAGTKAEPNRVQLTRPAPREPRAELRKLAHQLEGVFVLQMFKAMRESVPQGGLLDSNPGERLLQGVLDEKLASAAAEKARGRLSEAIYRQLSRKLGPETPVEAP